MQSDRRYSVQTKLGCGRPGMSRCAANSGSSSRSRQEQKQKQQEQQQKQQRSSRSRALVAHSATGIAKWCPASHQLCPSGADRQRESLYATRAHESKTSCDLCVSFSLHSLPRLCPLVAALSTPVFIRADNGLRLAHSIIRPVYCCCVQTLGAEPHNSFNFDRRALRVPYYPPFLFPSRLHLPQCQVCL